MTEFIGRGVVEVSADSSKLNAAINDARAKIKSLGDGGADANKRASASIDRYVKSLQTQAAVQGKSTRETELYKLALRGASDEQLRAANSALKLQEGFARGQDLAANIKQSAVAIGQAFLLIGTAAAAGAIAFNRIVKSAGDFKDIGEKIGDTGEAVASLAVAAGESGTSLEKITAGSVLLAKNLTGVDDESKAAGAAVKALGLNLGELQKLGAVDRLQAVAKALNGFADGPAKTAAAVALLGRAGAELLPFLKVLGEEGARQVILTQQQIDLADAYSDAQGKLIAETKLYAQAIAINILPSVNDFIGGIKDLISQVAGAERSVDSLKSNNSIADFADSGALFLARLIDIARRVADTFTFVGETIAGVVAIAATGARSAAESFSALKNFDLKGAIEADKRGMRELGSITDQLLANREKFAKGSASLEDTVAKRIAERRKQTEIGSGGGRGSAADPRRTDAPKQLKFAGAITADKSGGGDKAARAAAREAEQVRKAELDNDLKFLRDKFGEERDTIAFHQRELQAIYSAGNISLQQFYDDRERTITAGVTAELSILAQEQSRLQAELTKPAVKANQSERVKLEGDLAESLARTAKVEREAGRAATLAGYERAAAYKQLDNAVNDYHANLLQLQGDEAGAARLRAKQAIDQARLLAKQSEVAKIKTPGDFARFDRGQTSSDVDVEGLIRETEHTARLTKVKTETSHINQRLSIEEERIALQQRTGSIGEIEALRKIGDARTQIFAQAEKQVVELERLAKERPLDLQLTIDASQARLELEKFSAELDPLRDKFNDLFRDSAGDAINDFISGTKSAKDALKGFGKSILAEINSIASKQIAGDLFGQKGLLSGAGSLFADFFGGKKAEGFAGAGRSTGAGESGGSPLDAIGDIFGIKRAESSRKAPQLDTSAVSTSLSNLQTTGIDPSTIALTAFKQAVDGAAGSLSAKSTTTGEQSIADLFKGTSNDPSSRDYENESDKQSSRTNAEKDAAKSTGELSKTNDQAAKSVLDLAAAASRGGSAISLLPTIIRAIGSVSTATSAASGGGGGGIWGSLINAAVGYFTSSPTSTGLSIDKSGYSATYGLGYSNRAGISGGRAQGGPVEAGKMYLVSEQGPELLRIGSDQILMMGRKSGTVEPKPKTPRFHDGGIVGGAAAPAAATIASAAALAANEVPAILMGGPKGTREEVLHARDPRHSDNIAPTLLKVIQGGIGGEAIARAIGGPGGLASAIGGQGGNAIGGIGGNAFAAGGPGGLGGKSGDTRAVGGLVEFGGIGGPIGAVTPRAQKAEAPRHVRVLHDGGIVGKPGKKRPIPVNVLDQAIKYHDGGIVGQRTDLRGIPINVFVDAPKYHEGGVAGAPGGSAAAIGGVGGPGGVGASAGQTIVGLTVAGGLGGVGVGGKGGDAAGGLGGKGGDAGNVFVSAAQQIIVPALKMLQGAAGIGGEAIAKAIGGLGGPGGKGGQGGLGGPAGASIGGQGIGGQAFAIGGPGGLGGSAIGGPGGRAVGGIGGDAFAAGGPGGNAIGGDAFATQQMARQILTLAGASGGKDGDGVPGASAIGGVGGVGGVGGIGGIGGQGLGGLGGNAFSVGGPGGIGGNARGGDAFAGSAQMARQILTTIAGAPGGRGGDAIAAARETSLLMRTLVGPTNLISELRKETNNTERFENSTIREIKETGARALGGPVTAGGMYRVNERGPEVMTMAGRQYMMPMQDGKVEPTEKSRERPLAVTNNFAFSTPVDRRSQQQVSAATLSGARRLAMRIS